MIYSYHIDGPLPLSGKFSVSRHSCDAIGMKKFDKELSPDSKEFVEYTGMGENLFETLAGAVIALAEIVLRDVDSAKVPPRPMYIKK